LNTKSQRCIQQIIGAFLYYGRAVDLTILKALNSLSTQQAVPTEQTERYVKQFLDYLATHPHAKIRYFTSDMILQLHTDAAYANKSRSRSTAAGHFSLGKQPTHGKPLFLNGAIHTLCTVLKHVTASAAEAELGSLFLNAQDTKKLRLALEEMGHPQGPTPITCNNATAVGIANNTIKRN